LALITRNYGFSAPCSKEVHYWGFLGVFEEINENLGEKLGVFL